MKFENRLNNIIFLSFQDYSPGLFVQCCSIFLQNFVYMYLERTEYSFCKPPISHAWNGKNKCIHVA